MKPADHHLEAHLARATEDPDALGARLRRRGAEDVTGLPGASLAYVLARSVHGRRGAEAPPPRCLLVMPTGTEARALAEDLGAFLGDPSRVLLVPGYDVSPYAEVAPDRRLGMERFAALDRLASHVPLDFVVTSAGALARRVVPPSEVQGRALTLSTADVIDREALLSGLARAGYTRAPVAEDPGTFAVRGSIVDIFGAHERAPVRLEFDDDLLVGMKRFDAGSQRSSDALETFRISVARHQPSSDAALRRAADRVRALCDDVNLPTTRTNQLVDDVLGDRLFFGADGFVPAFTDGMVPLTAYLEPEHALVVVDPARVADELRGELTRARNDYAAKHEERAPAFPVGDHYVEEDALGALLREASRVFPVVVHGEDAATKDALTPLETPRSEEVVDAGASDLRGLASELSARRGDKSDHATLAPLVSRTKDWLEQGLRVVFSARSETQSDRLASVLEGYGLSVTRTEPFVGAPTSAASRRAPELAVAAVSRGFVLPRAALVVITEEEVFGARAKRVSERRRVDKVLPQGLEDLRELHVGDYVVHVDHGIGRYAGLERRALGQSASERMRGEAAASVELLVIEYASGDKLFLPVTRLGQIQKYASQGSQTPRLDKLGGQSFAKTKAKVREHVRRIADDLLKIYAERKAHERPPLPSADREFIEFEATFPFEETVDQARAIEDVLTDLEAPHPMDRLVCGDVGFGKTEVAIRAAFRTAVAGRQVALLCPTTVLAQQHFTTIQERFRDYPLRVEVLSRFVAREKQTEVLTGLKDGRVDVVVGTHRLLSKDVHFAKLGLLVVDEEQRFGVAHKERIQSLRRQVDVLTLSATPIPRTLQMAVGGLRDLSLITTAPVDRRAVRTLVALWDEQVVREAILREMQRGGQTFFVYNRIEGLYERAARLQELLPKARIVVAHGQMKEGELERAMLDFVEGQYDVLCATAIIESGLDIPRANTILIDRADMFGLAQLYQLRGRVGRSKERAYCYLLTPPLNQLTDEARYRVEALQRFTELGSGFHVASLDLELRGAGDVLGAEQSGSASLVGFDMFMQMLHEAVQQLRGEPVRDDIDPELTFDMELYLPDDYVDDVGVRLSFYKRFGTADTEAEVLGLGEELEDRFGPLPPPARQFVRAMALKPALRALRVLGAEAAADRVTFHLRGDTPIDPARTMELVTAPGGRWRLSPDMKLTRRFDAGERTDSIERVHAVLTELERLASKPA